MNCPKCNSNIIKPGRYCTACGRDFGDDVFQKLSFYFGLKDEFERFGAIRNDFNSGLEKISLRLQKYEELLAHDLSEAAVSRVGAGRAPAKPVQAAPDAASPERTPPAAARFEPEEIPAGKISPLSGEPGQKTSDLEVRVGQKWLLIAGILTMVFGVGYFLKYSFEQGWVGPAGRVAMAYVWGIVFLVAGDRFRKRSFETFGLSLVGGGIAVLYFAAFAAFQIYHLFDQAPSFAIMALITALASLLSILYDAKWLAVLGLVGGFLTPALLSTGRDNQIALMTYMTILNFGLLGIAFRKKWDLLNTLGFIFTYLLYTGWFARHYADHKFWPAVIFLNIFYLIYSVVPFVYQFMRKGGDKLKGVAIIVPNSLIAFGLSFAMIKDHFSLSWVSVITIFYSIVFLSMASYLHKKGKHDMDAFVVLLGKALLFLIITVPIIFSKHWITIFWAAQAIALLWMGIRLDRRSLIGGAYALFSAALLKFLLYDYGEVFRLDLSRLAFYNTYTFLIAERYLTSFLVLIMLSRAAAMAKKASLEIFSEGRKDSVVIFTAVGIFLFITLNVEIGAFFHDYLPQARFAAISVLWTLFSVGLMLMGFKVNSVMLRKVSFGVFLVTVLKVFLFDMANVGTPYRIISFLILGLMLVGMSYLYYKYRDRIITAMADDEKQG